MKKIELLAPAKDLECGIAAITCGADAVYIGAPQFGARESAGNSIEDIAELAKYAHKYWAKVYVTVNTLLYDDEIPSALRMISQLYDISIDGLIIQDTALLEHDLPPIPIIASTQMHNNTPEKVAFLEKVGVQRAILARELSLEQIRDISQNTNMELECFIHGSLCVCYSGQCYLSYALGRRSGNKGQCAQPCRKPYTLLDGRDKPVIFNKHLLSIRDLNLSDHLGEMIQAGVSSFKIEGRLKDKAYVSNVVAYYRAKLDKAIASAGFVKASSGISKVDFIPDVHKTFNRDYTTHFLHGRNRPIGSIDTPKMVGEAIGKVTSVARDSFVVETNIEMHNGDGICFFDAKGELRGTVVNGVNGKTITPDKIDHIDYGTYIYRNHDHQFITQLSKANMERQMAVTLTLREMPDGLLLIATDEDGNVAELAHQCEKTLAQKPEQALDNIQRQLSKSGGTEYICTVVKVELSEALFIPISVLNSLRRDVLEKLSTVRDTNRPIGKGKILKNDVPYPETELSFTANVLNYDAKAFYERHGVYRIEPAAETGLDLRGKKVMTTKYCLKHQLGICPKNGDTSRLTGPFTLVDAEGHKLDLRFDCAKCEMEVYLPRR